MWRVPTRNIQNINPYRFQRQIITVAVWFVARSTPRCTYSLMRELPLFINYPDGLSCLKYNMMSIYIITRDSVSFKLLVYP
jgi:hypothetical protein